MKNFLNKANLNLELQASLEAGMKLKQSHYIISPPNYFTTEKKQGWRLACNCIGGSLIPRGNVDIWVMEILMKTCWMRLLMLNVINSFCFWRETTLMINLLFSEQQFCVFVTSLHSITGICNYTFCFVIRPFTCFVLVFWHFEGFNQYSMKTCNK